MGRPLVILPRPVALTALSVLLGLSAACGGGGGDSGSPFVPSSIDSAPPEANVEAGCEFVPESCGADRRTETKAARIQKTKYLAFGDSITEGYPVSMSAAYPAQLQNLLSNKYPAQQIRVVNAGLGGETSAQGRRRLPGVLDRYRPEVLLLLEGYNNVRHVSPGSIADDLRAMVREGRRRGVFVILATLTPISPTKERDRPGTRAAVQAVNVKIRALAPQLGVQLVDLYEIMDGRWSLFGNDVHPNASGYLVMAQAFFKEIVRELGEGPGPLLSPERLTDFDPDPFEPAIPLDQAGFAPREPVGSTFDRGAPDAPDER